MQWMPMKKIQTTPPIHYQNRGNAPLCYLPTFQEYQCIFAYFPTLSLDSAYIGLADCYLGAAHPVLKLFISAQLKRGRWRPILSGKADGRSNHMASAHFNLLTAFRKMRLIQSFAKIEFWEKMLHPRLHATQPSYPACM